LEKKTRLIKTLLIIIAALIIVTLIVVAAIFGASRSEGGGNDGAENGENTPQEGDTPEVKTLSDYLMNEDVPFFDPSYLDVIEDTYRRAYYKPEDIPDSEALAKRIAELYSEHYTAENEPEDYMGVTYALINCLIETVGDKYSFYRTKEEADEYNMNMSGSFAGIGVEVLRNNIENTIIVEVVHIGSPAEGAGLLPGDYIVGVDGSRIEDIGAVEVINKIRGEVGKPVTVTVKRGSTELRFEMVRAILTEETVKVTYLEGGRIANIRITGFKATTAKQFATAINEVEKTAAEAIIFDLRNNGGGYLDAVTAMLSYLVPDGTPIASFSNGKAPVIASSGTELEPEDHVLALPSVVVVNGNSASASELFSASLRDYNDMEILDSTVVGTLTYKKGVMQSTYKYNDGSTLTLTISLYNPPSGVNFDGVGVTPDIEIKGDEDPIEKSVSVLVEKIN